MRFLWVDSSSSPDYVRAGVAGIDGFYFDMFAVSKSELQAVSAKGYAVGVYMASNWPPFSGASGPEIAELVDARVRQLSWSAVAKPKVQFDLEEHDPVKIASCLERWRELQPRRDTSWTLEGMQGGWMDDAFVQRVLACRVRIVPQAYLADMSPVAQDAVLRDLTRRGFPESVISVFYDAARLPASWNGFAFIQHRLPYVP